MSNDMKSLQAYFMHDVTHGNLQIIFENDI